MTSTTMGKLKTLLPFKTNHDPEARPSKVKSLLSSVDPEVGFQMMLVPNKTTDKATSAKAVSVPELHVKIIGARHLPSIFGLKTVQGYVVKAKLFPGTLRFDTSIQTASWPTFNETFKFPMQPTTKSSIKVKGKHASVDLNQSSSSNSSNASTLPEQLFKGHFLVLTCFALLELPAGTNTSFKDRLQQIRRQSSLLRTGRGDKTATPDPDPSASASAESNGSTSAGGKDITQLTRSEQRRNIGSVTCFLDPRMFDENLRTGAFGTSEMWLTLKDIATTTTQASLTSSSSISTYPKGQLELILQVCDLDTTAAAAAATSDTTASATTTPQQSPQKRSSASPGATNRWSLGDMRRKLSISGTGGKPVKQGLCLKIITHRMRSSIKIKEQFETMNHGCTMYIKTAVFVHDVLASAWKSDQFEPSLSVRWNQEESELRVPLAGVEDLQHIVVRTTIATKTKMGKKIVLGTVIVGGGGGGRTMGATAAEHWSNAAVSAGTAVGMWHAFE